MSKIAVVFPGQGSQFVGMGKDFYDAHETVRTIFDRADEVLGYSLTNIMFNGSEDDLKMTENTQPALLTMSVALWEVLKERVKPDFFAGHSLGEYSAVVAAGGMNFDDAVLAVHNRGKFMQQAVPVGVGAMAAVLGCDDSVVVRVCREVSTPDAVVEPANFNCPGQLVVAGHAAAVDAFNEAIKAAGAKRAVKLPVSAPFHCTLMMPAQLKMEEYLKSITITDLKTPICNNVDAAQEETAAVVRDALVRQVSSPVRWTALVENLVNSGVSTFIEVGAGSVLTGLIKKIDRSVRSIHISSVEDLAKLEEIGC